MRGVVDNELFSELTWLPRPPPDFYERCETLTTSAEAVGRRVRTLASFALDFNRLNALAKTIDALRAKPGALQPLIPFKLGIAGNATTHFLVPALVATAARHGVALECIEAGFDQALQEACDPASGLNRSRPDAVLVALDHRGLRLQARLGDSDAEIGVIEAAIGHLDAICRGFRDNGGAICVVQTIARPLEPTFGSLDMTVPGTSRHLIDAFNRRLVDVLSGGHDVVLDVAGLADAIGLARWHDPTLWNLAKIPFANEFLPAYAEGACRIVAALRGKSRRCLVLDLDNTLWGGVIGDDGLAGIVLGQGDPTGEAFLEVQRTVLRLRERGIVLAVCSKNEEELARSPFRSHPDMLLREEHIAVFQANWKDKAANLQVIASTLRLGLESLVFLDDNPVERGLVRELLPDVAVPELPDDPALYPRTLLAAGYFEAVTFLPEDRIRADAYRDNALRVAVAEGSKNADEYLRSLKTIIEFRAFDAVGRSRIAQLISKSNQFNLTTRRYSEADVARMENDPSFFTLQARLADTFGDSGMICVVICVREGEDWRIDTWLMSCRVLGRQVEEAVLEEVVRTARLRGIRRLIGTYIPTERNGLVKRHYAVLGFDPLGHTDDGVTHWELDIQEWSPKELPLTVTRSARREGP